MIGMFKISIISYIIISIVFVISHFDSFDVWVDIFKLKKLLAIFSLKLPLNTFIKNVNIHIVYQIIDKMVLIN